MVNDRDVIEENAQLLTGRWRFLQGRIALHDAPRLGMKPGFAAELCALNEHQVRLAADCTSPLFRLDPPDPVLLEVLRPLAGPQPAALRSEVDALIEAENELLLINRWNAARVSPIHCESLLGLSALLVGRLRAATLGDLQQAARRGVRLCAFAPSHHYLFHAGRNVSLQRSSRTVLAVCASAGRAG